jgi:SAM-dependent methyltransferase
MGWLQYLHPKPPEHIRLPLRFARRHVDPKYLTRPKEEIVDRAAAIGAGWVNTMAEIAGLSGEHRILDVGCGPGRIAIAIGEQFGWSNDYLGIDVRKPDIRFARRAITHYYPNFRFDHIGARNRLYNPAGKSSSSVVVFPVKDSSIDFVIALSVFTHMFTSEVGHYLDETVRVLAPNGTLFASFFCLHDVERVRAPRFAFDHPLDVMCSICNPERPEEAVAFGLYRLMDMIATAGFTHIEHHQGSWAGVSGRHSQDIIIARV